MNKCYLPLKSSIAELTENANIELGKVKIFHQELKEQIDQLLGEVYLLPQVMKAFGYFGEILAPMVNPQIGFAAGQLKEKDMKDKYDVYDKYFEVTRVNDMSYGQFVQQYLDTSAELIREIQFTSMSRGEIAYMLKGWEAANEIILKDKNVSTDISLESVGGDPNVPKDNDERALYRWKLAHHGFAIFKIFSGYCFDKAVEALKNNGLTDVIVDWLDKGAHCFRATGACMEFGNSFTASVYKRVVRVDMSKANDEANLPNGFSGTQNFDYITWRKAKVNLIKFTKTLVAEGKLNEEVKDALDLFKSFYLEDMQVHAIIALRMVGIEKSLLQEGFLNKGAKPVKLSAADVLRAMGKMREKEMEWLK